MIQATETHSKELPELYGLDETWTIRRSDIEGEGVFTTRWVTPGELVGVCIVHRLGGFVPVVTAFGSKINHSYNPNSVLRYDYTTGTHNLYSLVNLPPNTEVTVDYRNTPSYILGPEPHWQ